MTDRSGRKGETVRGESQLRGPILVHLPEATDCVYSCVFEDVEYFTTETPFMFFVNKEEILPNLRKKDETGPEVGNWGRLLNDGAGERRKWTLARRQ